MPVDIFQSRRTYNEYCRWWSRNQSVEDNDEFVRNYAPTGYFFAKEVTAETNNDNIINGTFMFDRSDVTLQTPDDLTGMIADDLVEYQGSKWVVESISKTKFRIQQSEYGADKNVSHIWTITLRK